MRIKILRFQNLNSLAGEWEIDFTGPAYQGNGIFAITGSTGAGKTTILDAICLALYGRTPRLERVNKSSNEIMSRHTGSCFAEIIFETGSGEYCCHWSQQRARKKADGELQAPKHEIADLRSGQILENRIRDVAAAVEQITGMDFIQFTRSMMLAQGGFAAFLQAPADERAPILEQITGTGIYSEISVRVHQLFSEKKKDMELLQAETRNIKVMNEAEEQELQQLLQLQAKQEAAGQEQLKVLHEALGWLDRIKEMEQMVSAIQLQWQDFLERQASFRADEERLRLARQAIGLDGPYSRLASMRELHRKEIDELEQLAAVIPARKEEQLRAALILQTAIHKLNEARTSRKKEGETARQARDMDLLINQLGRQIEELQAEADTAEAACLAWQGKIAEAREDEHKIAKDLAAAGAYLQENAHDDTLMIKFSGISRSFRQMEETAGSWQEKTQEHNDLLAALRQHQDELDLEISRHKQNQEDLQAQTDLRQSLQEQLDKLLQNHDIRWWRTELDKAREYKKQLLEVYLQFTTIRQAEEELLSQRKELQQFSEQQQQMVSVIENHRILSEKYGREVELLEQQTALENRIRDLEEERASLEDGSPCPLCGSTHHPYAQGNLPCLDSTTAALQQAREMFRKYSEDLQTREIQFARLEKETELGRGALHENETRLAEDREKFQQSGRKLQLDLNQLESPDEWQSCLGKADQSMESLSGQIKMIEDLQQKMEQINRVCEEEILRFSQSEKILQQAKMQLEQIKKDQERLQLECGRIKNELDEMLQTSLLEVAEYGISDLSLSGLPDILYLLEMRRDQWQERQTEKLRLQNALDTVSNDLAQYSIHLQNQREKLLDDRQKSENLVQEHTRQKDVRFEIYGDRDPDKEEARLDEEINLAESEAEKARQKQEMILRSLQLAEERSQILSDSTRNRTEELRDTESSFAQLLEQAGFIDEKSYLQASLSREEQQQLSARADQLADEATALKTRLAERQENLHQETARQLTDKSRDLLEQEQNQMGQDLNALRDQIGINKGMLKNSIDNRRQIETQLLKIEKQQEELQSWRVLHDLIGSADGKKFRNFAQGLTFEIMIGHANQQLQKMSDRYLLLRSPNQALELNVIDNYQGGEVRSTANLSGGESFLVSLALALGLSQMASHKVSVDSLFLDEGFGALDEDALDIALNTLAGLQHEGKLIGVISHVSALKERISTQIQVSSQAGGRSILRGPGCQSVKKGE
ncbi:MAG TPA: AAA family ATPase [Syntrophomonas sp.]|nr:AAA family ATPase [Syntrophomonas sp.]